MKHSARYIPKMGDEVTALGQTGLFVVIAVHAEPESVDLKLTGPREFILKHTPWGALKPTKKTREDVNQAAARIVREATEKG